MQGEQSRTTLDFFLDFCVEKSMTARVECLSISLVFVLHLDLRRRPWEDPRQLGAFLGRSWDLLESCWERSVPILRYLVPSWSRLVAVLALLGSMLGAILSHIGHFCAILEAILGYRERFWDLVECSSRAHEALLGALGPVLESPGLL